MKFDINNIEKIKSKLSLEDREKFEHEVQIAIADAQRLCNDTGLTNVLSEMRSTAAHFAVYGENETIRNENRIKVLMVDELCGTLEYQAKIPELRREQAERDRAME